MIITATESCGCRGCGQVIARDMRISWVTDDGPYHIACTPLVADTLAEQNRLEELLNQAATEWRSDPVAYLSTALSCLMLFVAAVGSHPYGYYQILRWVTCSTLVILAFRVYSQRKELLTWCLALAAFAYNPISPVHYSRSTWSVVNILTIVLLLVAAVAYYRNRERA